MVSSDQAEPPTDAAPRQQPLGPSFSGSASLWQDDEFRTLEASDIVEETTESLKPIDDLAVVVLFSVFESQVRDYLVERIQPQADSLTDPILKEAADDALQGVKEGSFYRRVLDPLKKQDRVSADLVTQVDQVRDCRNWVAHGRREAPTNNVTPEMAYERLNDFLAVLGIAAESEEQQSGAVGRRTRMRTPGTPTFSPRWLTQEEVCHPTASRMPPPLSQVVQEKRFRTASLLKRICQNRQARPAFFLVNRPCLGLHRAVVPFQPGRIDYRRMVHQSPNHRVFTTKATSFIVKRPASATALARPSQKTIRWRIRLSPIHFYMRTWQRSRNARMTVPSVHPRSRLTTPDSRRRRFPAHPGPASLATSGNRGSHHHCSHH